MYFAILMGPKCTVCADPKRAEFEARIQSESVKSLAAELGLSLPAAYRHVRARHHQNAQQAAQIASGSTIAPLNGSSIAPSLSATILKATRLAKAAERHMRKALKSDDLKAANGALASATKAFELFGKATGQLQTGGNVSVNVSAEARSAMDLQGSVSNLTHAETSEHAKTWLAAQLEAGDRDAVRIVLELVRMIPSADASTEPQGLTGELSPSIGRQDNVTP